jgi:hypothetical protein
VTWTSDYCASVATHANKGVGVSKIDNTSAACSHYMIRKGLKNPFHHADVKAIRQSLARARAELGDIKAKAGAFSNR